MLSDCAGSGHAFEARKCQRNSAPCSDKIATQVGDLRIQKDDNVQPCWRPARRDIVGGVDCSGCDVIW